MVPSIASGGPSYDLTQLLGGVMLVLSFGLLYQHRIGTVINTYTMQAAALAAAVAWQGWVQDAAGLYVLALIALGAQGMAIPLALHRMVRRLRIHGAGGKVLGVFPSTALGLGLVALSIGAVVLPTATRLETLMRQDLAVALAVVLLGLLMMITWRTALAQVIGCLSLGNGLVLATVSVQGMPLMVELSVAVLAMLDFVAFFCIRERFDRNLD
jgi:hydrogenase-4 component E